VMRRRDEATAPAPRATRFRHPRTRRTGETQSLVGGLPEKRDESAPSVLPPSLRLGSTHCPSGMVIPEPAPSYSRLLLVMEAQTGAQSEAPMKRRR